MLREKQSHSCLSNYHFIKLSFCLGLTWWSQLSFPSDDFTWNISFFLPALGLGLSTISKPLTSRAQFSCTKAAHGTVREIVWMNPAMTSKGASAFSKSSLSDWEIWIEEQNYCLWRMMNNLNGNDLICFNLLSDRNQCTYPFIQWHLCQGASALIKV